jgi:hypothetical protein
VCVLLREVHHFSAGQAIRNGPPKTAVARKDRQKAIEVNKIFVSSNKNSRNKTILKPHFSMIGQLLLTCGAAARVPVERLRGFCV